MNNTYNLEQNIQKLYELLYNCTNIKKRNLIKSNILTFITKLETLKKQQQGDINIKEDDFDITPDDELNINNDKLNSLLDQFIKNDPDTTLTTTQVDEKNDDNVIEDKDILHKNLDPKYKKEVKRDVTNNKLMERMNSELAIIINNKNKQTILKPFNNEENISPFTNTFNKNDFSSFNTETHTENSNIKDFRYYMAN
jgi:hypothetical protein